jgi:NitT/TauT family transport system substrate-binding protein
MKRLYRFLTVSICLMIIGALVPTTGAAVDQTSITLFLGYVPNVQFAPIYVAIERGYFKEAGIDIKLENSFDETDGVTRVATNKLQFALVSGEQVLLARAQGAPIVYVFRWYQRFPVGVVVPADSPIMKPEDLAGRVVGVPAKYGASYIGLQALLNAVKLKESDLKELKVIGYDTAPVVCGGQVEASVVYIANEPAQIESKCFKVRLIKISDYANIVSNGLITNEVTLKDKPELVRGMNSALARGLADTLADPKAAYAISRKYVENLPDDDPVQFAVLTNSLDLWKADRLGYSDPVAWKLTLDTLQAMGLVAGQVNLDKAFTNDYLPSQAAMATAQATDASSR